MAEPKEIEEILADLADAYPDWRPANMTSVFRQYVESLRNFSPELIKQAANRCRDTCTFFPKIAELRKAIEQIRLTYVRDTSQPYMEKIPITPEIEKMINDFRRKMEDEGKWRTGRRHANDN